LDSARTPVTQVAARTLRQRLELVRAELRAACDERESVEHVHQLRVASRRAIAALDAFDRLLPAKRRAWFDKRLRRLRRAAGDARDLDVLAERLAASRPPESGRDRARARLVAMLSRQRRASREPIQLLRSELDAEDWHAHVERLIESLPGAKRLSLGRYARERLEPMVARFFAIADRKLRDAEEIHRLRIEGKKLRYALEIFAAVFPPAARRTSREALETLQETLGEFTDHAAAADRFRRWSREDGMRHEREAIRSLGRYEEDRAEEARREFSRWWSGARRRDLRRTLERSLERRTA